jgi:hypothetical protein
VTKIPPEHTAAKALEHAFRALGEERARARGAAPRRRAARIAGAAAVSVLAVAGAATGTRVFTGDGGEIRSDSPGAGDRVEPEPGYRQLAQASAADPVQEQRWGLRTFRSARGETCIVDGRVVGGRLGVVRGGQFKEFSARTPATGCGPLERDHVVVGTDNYVDRDIKGGRTLLFGVVDRTITAVTVRLGDDATPVGVAADGSFIAVHRGVDAFRGAQLVFEGPGGHRTQPLGR